MALFRQVSHAIQQFRGVFSLRFLRGNIHEDNSYITALLRSILKPYKIQLKAYYDVTIRGLLTCCGKSDSTLN